MPDSPRSWGSREACKLQTRPLLLALAATATLATDAFAAERQRCLTQQERRNAIASKAAVPLGRAVRALKGHIAGDVIRARLCESRQGLVYRLTVLSRDGKVRRAIVDAVHGRVLTGR